MSMPKIMVGCDPEVFMRNTETGKFVAPYGMIPGDKAKPFPVPKGAIQVDGMAVEFNIDPAKSKDEWIENITTVRKEMLDYIPAGHELVVVPTADFDPDYWQSLPKEALEIGCVPDYNVYTGRENPRPDGAAQFFRSAAGHIHIGWTKDKPLDDVDHIADCVEVAKQLDFYVGIPSGMWDKDQRRRQLYGKAGSIRIKSYGLEYRTPSNMWLTNTALTGFVYDATIAAVTDLFEGNALRTKCKDGWAQQCIDGARGPTMDTMYVIGQYSNRLAKLGIYSMQDMIPKAPPKPKIKPVGIENEQAFIDFRFRNRRIEELDLRMVEDAINFMNNQFEVPNGVIPALMGRRDRLRGGRDGFLVGGLAGRAVDPVEIRGNDVRVMAVDAGPGDFINVNMVGNARR